MRINLLNNGLDSLKKGFDYLKKYEERYFLEDVNNDRMYYLKDAIIFIHHGIEILFKEALFRENELLIFTEIDKSLKNAYIERRQQNLDSLFEANQKLNTVSFRESMDRVQKICGFVLNDVLRRKLDNIEKYRNKITHSEITLDEIEVNNTFEGLIEELDVFFLQAIGDEYSNIRGYKLLKENYKVFLSQLDENKRKIKQEAIEKFLKAFEECSILMGQNEVKIIKDINIVSKLMNILFDSNLMFGIDLYNGYCSGDIKQIKRINSDSFSIITNDIRAEWWFKFNSLLVFLPKVHLEISPILFFESDDDHLQDGLEENIRKESDGSSVIKGIRFIDEDRIEWNPNEIDEFYHRLNEEYSIEPRYRNITRFLNRKIFCLINVQMLRYGRFDCLLTKMKDIPMKEFFVEFRKALE